MSDLLKLLERMLPVKVGQVHNSYRFTGYRTGPVTNGIAATRTNVKERETLIILDEAKMPPCPIYKHLAALHENSHVLDGDWREGFSAKHNRGYQEQERRAWRFVADTAGKYYEQEQIIYCVTNCVGKEPQRCANAAIGDLVTNLHDTGGEDGKALALEMVRAIGKNQSWFKKVATGASGPNGTPLIRAQPASKAKTKKETKPRLRTAESILAEGATTFKNALLREHKCGHVMAPFEGVRLSEDDPLRVLVYVDKATGKVLAGWHTHYSPDGKQLSESDRRRILAQV